MKPLFLRLRNGALVKTEDMQMILRKDINDYFIILKQQDATVRADRTDIDFITENVVDVLEVPEPPKEEVRTKLLVQE